MEGAVCIFSHISPYSRVLFSASSYPSPLLSRAPHLTNWHIWRFKAFPDLFHHVQLTRFRKCAVASEANARPRGRDPDLSFLNAWGRWLPSRRKEGNRRRRSARGGKVPDDALLSSGLQREPREAARSCGLEKALVAGGKKKKKKKER